MPAMFISQVITIPLLHALTLRPIWTEAEAGGEIVMRDDDKAADAWKEFPQVRPLIFPWMGNLECAHLGAVVAIKIDPGKEMQMPDGVWYEAILQAAPEVKSEFKEGAMSLGPGGLWMWEGPMRRHNPSEHPAISLIFAMEAA
jgi:hypothetical protein